MTELKYYEGLKRQAETTVAGLQGNLDYLKGIRDKTDAEITAVEFDLGSAKAHLEHIKDTIERIRSDDCEGACTIGGVPGG